MFIVVTGLDGTGKTSLVSDIASELSLEPLHLPRHNQVQSMLDQSGYGSQFADTWTDRLIFALDNRLTNYIIKEKRGVVSQRGWMDSLVHGAVQGYEYNEMIALSGINELTKPDASIHLVCDVDTAWKRLENSPFKDKYETLDYLRKQLEQTERFYRMAGSDELVIFDEPKLRIDTTDLTQVQTFNTAIHWLREVLQLPVLLADRH